MKTEIDFREVKEEKRAMTTVQTEFCPAKASTVLLQIFGVIIIGILLGLLGAAFSP